MSLLPTIQQLIDCQKTISIKLSTNPITSKYARQSKFQQVMMNENMDHTIDNMFDKNSWDQIGEAIEEVKAEIEYMCGQPLSYQNGERQARIQKLRIETDKLKLRKAKLDLQIRRVTKQNKIQMAKLDSLVSELERVENQAKLRGHSISHPQPNSQNQATQQQKQTIYPSLQQLTSQINPVLKDEHLKVVEQLHWANKPIAFFSQLASAVMGTDKRINYLKKVKLEEESEIDIKDVQLKKLQENQKTLLQNLENCQKEEIEAQKVLNNIQGQISALLHQDYVQNELAHRVQVQRNQYEKQGKKMHLSIVKLFTMIQLSGNQSAKNQAQVILHEHGFRR